jgi:hypothetical protein
MGYNSEFKGLIFFLNLTNSLAYCVLLVSSILSETFRILRRKKKKKKIKCVCIPRIDLHVNCCSFFLSDFNES